MRLLKLSIIFFAMFASVAFSKIDEKPAYFIASIKLYLDNVTINPSKIDAATALAIALSEKYYYCSLAKSDSVAKVLENEKTALTPLSIAKKLNADYALFFNINQSANLLRVDLTAVDINSDTLKYSGIGWSLLKFKTSENDSLIIDPSLLEGVQRAFADMTKDSALYSNQKDLLRAIPKDPLLIASINYIESDYSEKWQIFKDRITGSYDALSNIFETFYKSEKFFPIDIESRDLLYVKNNFIGAENYSAPTTKEISLLAQFGIEYFIFGELEFGEENLQLTLYLCKVKDDKIVSQINVSDKLEKDDLQEYRELIKKLSNELIVKSKIK